VWRWFGKAERAKRRGWRWTLARALRLPAVLAIALAGFWSCAVRMPGRSHAGALPPAGDPTRETAKALEGHVRELATTIGERNVGRYEALKASEKYLERTFKDLGYDVDRQTFSVGAAACSNLAVERAGKTREIVVIGAHYDSAIGAPGADDNGSGTAALLVLARLFAKREGRRALRFVAFVNEEPPYFQNAGMGSREYARRCRERGDAVVAMLSLETMGYFSDREGSQKYPMLFSAFYPSQGNFIGFVGDVASRDLVRRVVGTFRASAAFPSEGAALPAAIPGVGWSDQWSFWQEGYRAVMVTDTAPFRYPYYHTSEDTPDKLDYERFARVTLGLEKVIDDLVNGE
jgi:hypothetical protein